jgi:metal-responsive CopG/Arc/MetJ family transcriptional regulator
MNEETEGRMYLSVLLDKRMIKEIDNFRFTRRFPSRTEAIRWLLAYALKQKPKPEKEKV